MQYIGCDQHKHFCVMTALDEQGNKLNQQKIYHDDREALKRYLAAVPADSHLAMEACGFDAWLCDVVEEQGIKVHLANPLKTRAIAEAKIKTDEIDAHTLANLLRGNLLCESYYAPMELRQKRYLMRYRQFLVFSRTGVKNKVHSLLSTLGICDTPEVSDLFGKKGTLWLKSLNLPGTYNEALLGYLKSLEFLKERISEVESKIREFLEINPMADLLQTIPGIGPISTYLLLAEIGPIERFRSSEKLCAYAGLVPSLHQSGQTHYQGRITKQGNRYIRWILTEAAHSAIRQDVHLKNFHSRILKKKGAHKANIAVARKLLTYTYQILTKKEPYKPYKMFTEQARVPACPIKGV